MNSLDWSKVSREEVWEREELKLIRDVTGVASWDFEPNANECSWSKEMFLLMGQDAASCNPSYEGFLKGVHSDDRQWVDVAIRAAVSRRTEYSVQFRVVLPDKSTRWVSARGKLIFSNDGPSRMVGVLIDITQRRLAVNGQLVAATAHELKNPLATMFNLLYLLRQNPSLDNSAHERIICLQTELKRMRVIVDQTLGMYRESASPREVKLSEIIDTIVEFYKPKIEYKHITVEKRYVSGGLIAAVPSDMQQVFTNIVVNALEAVAPGGKLTIHLYSSSKWDEPLRKGVRVVIADNGPGIPTEQRRTIFEPLFTTKGDKGSGLGLWVVHGMVDKCGGSIRVRSSVHPGNSGTVFSVFLPDSASGVGHRPAEARLPG